MTPSSSVIAYPAQHFNLGSTADGRAVALAPMTAESATRLGTATATYGPWRHYSIPADAMARTFAPAVDNGARYEVRVVGDLAGGMVIRNPWLVGPYLQTIALLPASQGGGVGGLILAWFEARAQLAGQRNVWLCVSAHNVAAQRFYLAHGWQTVADLPDLIRDGDGEILMRKRLHSPTL